MFPPVGGAFIGSRFHYLLICYIYIDYRSSQYYCFALLNVNDCFCDVYSDMQIVRGDEGYSPSCGDDEATTGFVYNYSVTNK